MSISVRRTYSEEVSLPRPIRMHEGVRVSAVIPTLDEADNLRHVLPRLPSIVTEVIIVDGHSKDGTVEEARRLRPDVRVVYADRRGKGAALIAGFEAATGDIIVALDADGSTDPAEIPAYVGALLAGADYAKGSRFMQGAGTADMSWYRKLGNFGFVTIVRLLFGGTYSDLCYGYNAFWKHSLDHIQPQGDGFEIETVMNVRALRAGLKVVEVASYEACRMSGESRLKTFPDGFRVLKAIFREWLGQNRPERLPETAENVTQLAAEESRRAA